MTATPLPSPSANDHGDGFTACVMVFNSNDPSGAAGLAADLLTIASIGTHALPVMSGTYMRDTAEIQSHFALDDEAVTEQARVILEDVAVQAIKVGFVGSPENLRVIAELASDYADVPLLTYMPDLSWWREDLIDLYQDACQELLLPQTTVLVGNHSTLCRWLLPDWSAERSPGARDIARAANECGVAFTLVTGIPVADQYIENTLCSPTAILCTLKYLRIDALFSGAGETLSAAMTALIANKMELTEAAAEALSYLDRCLDNGFRPGMGNAIPDRMFWADGKEDGDDEEESSFEISPHGTRH
ncbi:MAG: bifunctional hydroxymethylpyrimidine kinase/phosphomethylpyrimidine kinase [Rhodoferax sp.]|nr:bifunctional hydroxymethylpyrimidine kinase/phosphomethylpyrimidine kinase [Rhodoferax sp.]